MKIILQHTNKNIVWAKAQAINSKKWLIYFITWAEIVSAPLDVMECEWAAGSWCNQINNIDLSMSKSINFFVVVAFIRKYERVKERER